MKTVFIMPKANFKTGELRRFFGFKGEAKKFWANLKLIAEEKFDFPNYRRSGGIVFFAKGKFRFTRGLSGRPWYSKKFLKKVFEDAEISSDPPWADSIRIWFRVVIMTPLISLIVFLIISLEFPETFTTNGRPNILDTKTLSLLSIIVFMALLSYYRYCSYFLLTNKKQIILFITTIAVFFIGYWISEKVVPLPETSTLVDLTHPIWIAFVLIPYLGVSIYTNRVNIIDFFATTKASPLKSLLLLLIVGLICLLTYSTIIHSPLIIGNFQKFSLQDFFLPELSYLVVLSIIPSVFVYIVSMVILKGRETFKLFTVDNLDRP